jgi:adenylate cyclase
MTDVDERREMIEILTSLGVDEADVPDSLADAAAMASDVVLARGDAFSLRDIARLTGAPLEQVTENFLHLGIHSPDPDAVIFNDDDVALASFLIMAIQQILTESEGQEILHVAGTALSSIAEAAVAGHVQGPESRTRNFVENARLNATIAELGLELSRQLTIAFRHHLRQSALSNRNAQNFENRALATLTVGFLDLVGFTSLSQELSIEDLVELVKGFESRAHELAHIHGTRIVKLIGDEVMIVAEKPAAAAEFVAGMIRSFDADRVVPRGGLAHGDLVNIHGDYFGPIVNLAARLTDAAVPGEVLVDDAVADQVTTEPAGRRMLKGFDEPIRVHTLVTPEVSSDE